MSDPQYAEVVCGIPLERSLTYLIPPKLSCGVGQRVTVFLGSRKLTGYVIEVHSNEPKGSFTVKPIHRVVDAQPIFGPEQISLAQWMADLYVCSLGEALSAMLPGGKRDVQPPAFDADDHVSQVPLQVSDAQRDAVDAVNSGEHRMCYLYGVTGSGKTEVFLQAAEHALARGQQVIYLVPEISLTHQLSMEVMNRFPGTVAVLHSSLTPSQRLREWNRIRNGEASLVIGARSAVFAPVPSPGLIIIDEEHENSYKSGSHPRYHARQVAWKRVQPSGGTLVMGSATPSLEAWKLIQDGVMKQLHLPKRISGGSMPEITVVDLMHSPGPLSAELRREMHAVLSRGKQVILFLNRRGFSYFFHCRSCGSSLECPHCSVSLTFHKSSSVMRCHYCGYSRRPAESCPSCRSLDVGYSGFGTELVESEVKRVFPQARALRIDTDSVKEKSSLQDSLRKMRNGEADILLGTQMVAKGLNFPLVELVGIVLADSGLNIPDFRAQERTFSLLTQVAGRAGRFSNAGRVIIQTYHPENPAVRCALDQDLEMFYRLELDVRKSLGFPPYSRICRMVFRGKSRSQVENTSKRAAEVLQKSSADILGPSPCPIERIAGNWRSQIILRSLELKVLLACAHRIRRDFSSVSGIYTEIDIDPVSLL